MKIKELWNLIDAICPPDLAEEWDNSGPQISFEEDELTNVLVALEITFDVIKEAVSKNANCILTHHPQFFDGNAWITPEYTIGKYTLELVKNRISVYSAHTSFDSLKGGNNDYFGKVLGIESISMPSDEGMYRLGDIKKMKVADLIHHICERLSIDERFVHLVGNPNKEVSRIAWCTGAGFDMSYQAYNDGAECFITGDLKYHDARDAKERGMTIIDIGHFGSEKIFAENMASLLRGAVSDIEIIESEMDEDPFVGGLI